ncbi:glycosyltransferase family 2 protein [Vogesella sp. LIG4]|uniref:glycosyltransferase family 2 protein n=1 Tax=Vogesella sp. LIG4 TaxID=1192162 RepID=UPI00081FC7AA|nr:glycosyltransferase [Vogesella sp. LIG4]SCK19462.1 Glycosyltransferase, GT2 family [Vogesella sp. LIG4]
MTAPSSWITFRPERTLHLHAPRLRAGEVSVVIPVRDNQPGVIRLLRSIANLTELPKEVVVVDNLSQSPLSLPGMPYPVSIVSCHTPGPAAARNAGAQASRGEWIWFLDSDCIVQRDALLEFERASGDVIGMAGRVKSSTNRLLGRYYDSQEILFPQFAEDEEPLYLITASACIHRASFFAVGGFDESFPLAAGEDIDLGFRLFGSGRLAFVHSAIVHHDFEEDTGAFIKRFQRYGLGNRLLAKKYNICLAPSPFIPNHPTYLKRTLAKIQYEALLAGYSQSV